MNIKDTIDLSVFLYYLHKENKITQTEIIKRLKRNNTRYSIVQDYNYIKNKTILLPKLLGNITHTTIDIGIAITSAYQYPLVILNDPKQEVDRLQTNIEIYRELQDFLYYFLTKIALEYPYNCSIDYTKKN